MRKIGEHLTQHIAGLNKIIFVRRFDALGLQLTKCCVKALQAQLATHFRKFNFAVNKTVMIIDREHVGKIKGIKQ